MSDGCCFVFCFSRLVVAGRSMLTISAESRNCNDLTLAMSGAVLRVPEREVSASDGAGEAMEERASNQVDNLLEDDDPGHLIRRRIERDAQRVTEEYNHVLPRESMFISVNLKRPARNRARNADRQSY